MKLVNNKLKCGITLIVFFLLLNSFVFQGLGDNGSIIKNSDYEYSYEFLDLKYIYNITENLSNIIFTEYNESAGEIAKGRAFGTKGEHKAAQILYDNFTALGLYTYYEQINNTEQYPELTHELEISDYFVKIDEKEIESYIAPVWFETSENDYSLNYTYNYSNLKVIKPKINPIIYLLKQKIKGTLEPFVIILKDRAFYPHNPLGNISFLNNFKFKFYVIRQLQCAIPILYSMLWENYLDYFKGLILYDFFNEDVYDMNLLKYANCVPFIYINKSCGKEILENIDNTRIDFKLSQQLNTSVISYNVIGQINGTYENKTVIVDCLYDSWWCQGTADSAIGMSMVVAIAKYFKENNITPKYTIKFIGFSGEEAGLRGAKYYASSHLDEDIVYMIDLNQLGFNQTDPKLVLNIIGNDGEFLDEIENVCKDSNYANRVDSSIGLDHILIKKGIPIPSNPMPFADTHPDCKVLCFLKDNGWTLHHRDGLNHTEGDVLKYFDPEDVNVTGEIILNVVKYLTTDF
ncbi:MAG: M20/M25/M40 family metallo-hydrolase [Thermoplasmatales archaeon]|nr:M20/M25/M40 family metallo-hydrolase [Thermoplasmatales archaeon]